MKVFKIVLAGGLLLGAPAFADSVTVQTQTHESAGVVVSPPVAVVPAPVEQRTETKDTIKQSEDGVQREQKRTQEIVTPNGTARTTTKVQTNTGN